MDKVTIPGVGVGIDGAVRVHAGAAQVVLALLDLPAPLLGPRVLDPDHLLLLQLALGRGPGSAHFSHRSGLAVTRCNVEKL